MVWIYGEMMTMTIRGVDDITGRLRHAGFRRTTEWEQDGPALCANLKQKGENDDTVAGAN